MSHDYARARIAVTDLLTKVNSYWSPERLKVQNPLRPVRDIVHASQLSTADVDYLRAEAPHMLVEASSTRVYVDYSLLTEVQVIRSHGQSVELDVQVLRTWHLLLLRSEFWHRYHEAYEQFGQLTEVNQHADALWNMIDPLFETQGRSKVVQSESVRSAVVFRQILGARSELSDLHPADALAHLCIPGYTERLHEYVQTHASEISQLLGLSV